MQLLLTTSATLAILSYVQVVAAAPFVDQTVCLFNWTGKKDILVLHPGESKQFGDALAKCEKAESMAGAFDAFIPPTHDLEGPVSHEPMVKKSFIPPTHDLEGPVPHEPMVKNSFIPPIHDLEGPVSHEPMVKKSYARCHSEKDMSNKGILVTQYDIRDPQVKDIPGVKFLEAGGSSSVVCSFRRV